MIPPSPAPPGVPPLKRILSLDGGGIRGVFSLRILARIEEIFRAARGRPDLVLRDEFHLLAGTSTGGIIATCLAWGMSVAEVERLYRERAHEMFQRGSWLARAWRARYRSDALAGVFRELFSEDGAGRDPALLGSRRLWVGDTPRILLLVMRNASTGSPWPITNNPRARYNDPALPDCNLHLPLWQLIRASTAAPAFFPPEEIQLAGRPHLFVDGGISPYNNPGLIAFLTATLPPYRLEWPTGPDRLQLVSVGTGAVRTRLAPTRARSVNLLDLARYVIPALLEAVSTEQDLVCRVLGESRQAAELDSELGDLAGAHLPGMPAKLFAYLRYNEEFDRRTLEDLGGSRRIRFALDNLDLMPFLHDAGQAYAERAVRAEHFDLTPPPAG